LLAASGFVAAAVSIHDGLPAEWGSGFAGPLALHSNPEHTSTAFLTWRGTAIAPPLAVLILIAALAGAAAAGRRWAVAGLTLLAAVALVGYFGEPLVRRRLFRSPAATQTTVVAAQLVLDIAVVVLGVRTLYTSSAARAR
jgi:hypothetical protein